MSLSSYKELLVWQKGMDLAVDSYSLTKDFPESEKFGLVSQIRRSAASISANIAEGYGRQSAKSYSQFIKIARGSMFELETHLILSERLMLITKTELYNRILANIIEEGKMLNVFIKKLDEQK